MARFQEKVRLPGGRSPLRLSLAPAFHPRDTNAFTILFAKSLQEQGFVVDDFSWSAAALLRRDAVVFHWPTGFLNGSAGRRGVERGLKLAALAAAQRLRRTRFVWVAHNVRPHDDGPFDAKAEARVQAFLNLLDGVIYLSESSRREVLKHLPALRETPSLVTTHGHYRPAMLSAPTPRRALGPRVRLCFIGQVRPYKNVEALVSCVAQLPPDAVDLHVLGKASDPALIETLRRLAAGHRHIRLDLRSQFVPDEELERALDDADAAVLPYRDILNSGAALYALSRDRPLLAPRVGSLPELQASAGGEWVNLYEGELGPATILNFIDTLRQGPLPPRPESSANEWSLVGRQLGTFLSGLISTR